MKLFFLFCFSILSAASIASAQIPPTAWLRHGGGQYGDGIAAMAISRSGELNTVGGWSDGKNFCGMKLMSGIEGGFLVVHHNNNQVPQWGQFITCGHEGFDVNAMAVDDSGNIYVGGNYYYFIGIDHQTAIGGGHDYFLAKFHTDSILEWIITSGGNGNNQINAIAPFPGGGVVVIGRMAGTLYQSKNMDLNTPFVERFDASGKMVWFDVDKAYSSPDAGQGIATDPAGNIYLTSQWWGKFIDTTMGGTGTIVAKLDRDGHRKWVWSAESSQYHQTYSHPMALGLDRFGHIYVTGYASGGTQFGIDSVQGAGLDGSLFLAKFNASGKILWVTGSNKASEFYDESQELSISPSGEPVIGGFFTYKMSFQGSSITSTGKADGFIARFTANGTLRWIDQLGGIEDDQTVSLAFDSSGALYAGGFFTNSATIVGTTVNAVASSDMFLIKYAPQLAAVSSQPNAKPIVLVYPNPANDHITLRYSVGNVANIRVEIHDNLGRSIWNEHSFLHSSGDHSQTMDISSLTSGTYVAAISIDGQLTTCPFVITR